MLGMCQACVRHVSVMCQACVRHVVMHVIGLAIRMRPFVDRPESERLANTINVNFDGFIRTFQTLRPVLRESGRVVAVTSRAGLVVGLEQYRVQLNV